MFRDIPSVQPSGSTFFLLGMSYPLLLMNFLLSKKNSGKTSAVE